MPVKETVKSDDRLFQELKRNLKKVDLVTKVGIVGDLKARVDLEGGDLTNAEVGMLAEFGTENSPPRSWLRMPLEFKRQDIIRYIKSDPAQKLILGGNVKRFFENLGLVAEAIIQNAFETSGFGKWAPNAPLTIAIKGSDKPNIDTSQLRAAVSTEVVKKKDLKK